MTSHWSRRGPRRRPPSLSVGMTAGRRGGRPAPWGVLKPATRVRKAGRGAQGPVPASQAAADPVAGTTRRREPEATGRLRRAGRTRRAWDRPRQEPGAGRPVPFAQDLTREHTPSIVRKKLFASTRNKPDRSRHERGGNASDCTSVVRYKHRSAKQFLHRSKSKVKVRVAERFLGQPFEVLFADIRSAQAASDLRWPYARSRDHPRFRCPGRE